MEYYTSVLKKYAVFSGRASRREFWMFTLISTIIAVVLSIIEPATKIGNLGEIRFLELIYSLAVFIPSLAVGVRRLHDTDRRGSWILIAFIPLLGVIALIVFFAIDSTPGDNKYGPNPKGVPAQTPPVTA